MSDRSTASHPAVFPKLAIIVPCFNEEVCIAPTLDELLGVLVQVPFTWEVIVVDDGSRDSSCWAASPCRCPSRTAASFGCAPSACAPRCVSSARRWRSPSISCCSTASTGAKRRSARLMVTMSIPSRSVRSSVAKPAD